MAFTFFIFIIIFAEIFRGIGYYNLAEGILFVYLARIFLVLGICVLVHFSFLDIKGDKNLKATLS